MKKRTYTLRVGLVAALAIGGMFVVHNAQADAVFVFNDGTAFDGNTGIGTTMTAFDGLTPVIMETVDIIDWEGDLASAGGTGTPTLNIGSSDGLAVNSTPNGTWGNEATSINPGEGWVFKFDTDVTLVELDFASQSDGCVLVLSSPGFTSKTLDFAHGDANGTHSLDYTFVTAGTEMTLQFTEYPTDPFDDVVRLSSFTVATIPEPTTLSLISFAAIGALTLRRRRV